MNRDVLAEDVAVADFQPSRFTLVLQVLRLPAEDGVAENFIVGAHDERSDEMNPSPQDATRADPDVALDNDVRPNLDVIGQVGFRRDDGGGMDAGGLLDRHGGPRLGMAGQSP